MPTSLLPPTFKGGGNSLKCGERPANGLRRSTCWSHRRSQFRQRRFRILGQTIFYQPCAILRRLTSTVGLQFLSHVVSQPGTPHGTADHWPSWRGIRCRSARSRLRASYGLAQASSPVTCTGIENSLKRIHFVNQNCHPEQNQNTTYSQDDSPAPQLTSTENYPLVLSASRVFPYDKPSRLKTWLPQPQGHNRSCESSIGFFMRRSKLILAATLLALSLPAFDHGLSQNPQPQHSRPIVEQLVQFSAQKRGLVLPDTAAGRQMGMLDHSLPP